MGTAQDDLAAAWRTPFLQAGARLVSQSPARLRAALVGDDLAYGPVLKRRLYGNLLYPRCCSALCTILLVGYVFHWHDVLAAGGRKKFP